MGSNLGWQGEWTGIETCGWDRTVTFDTPSEAFDFGGREDSGAKQ